jgi:hypothetical protein
MTFFNMATPPIRLTMLVSAQSPLEDVMAITSTKRAVTFRTLSDVRPRCSLFRSYTATLAPSAAKGRLIRGQGWGYMSTS